MGKELFFNRYSLIIKRLEKSPANFAQIENYLFKSSTFQDSDTATYSIRTLQRDIKDIEKLFNIEIKNERKGDKRYFIESSPKTEHDEYNQILLESHQIINAINKYPDFANYVFLEARKPRGVEHFYNLLLAIQNKKMITFSHYKYKDTEPTERKVHPYALKESKNRWYLLALDTKDNTTKTFGLDRIDNIDVLNKSYTSKDNEAIKVYYKEAFGVITSTTKTAENIILKCTKSQAEYIKSFPLHHSQTIITENNTHTTFGLQLIISYDFIQEILSFGKDAEVIAPLNLRAKVKEIIEQMLAIY